MPLTCCKSKKKDSSEVLPSGVPIPVTVLRQETKKELGSSSFNLVYTVVLSTEGVVKNKNPYNNFVSSADVTTEKPTHEITVPYSALLKGKKLYIDFNGKRGEVINYSNEGELNESVKLYVRYVKNA